MAPVKALRRKDSIPLWFPSLGGIDCSRLQIVTAIEEAVEEVVVPENDDDWIEAKPVMKYPACTFQNDAWA